MDDHGCPRCKTTKYRNPSLKLMVNVCGHTLCENCVEMLFVRGSGNCVQCDTPLRKSNFRVQLFEDPTVDKEVEIRKKVLKIYNKRDVDFPSLREYNDYLEQVEDIVFNLTNNIDVENTKLQMEEYQRENRDVIQRNKAKLTREQEELEELLLLEQRDNEQRRLEVLQEEQRQLQAKRKNKQALLDELEQSKLPATLLLAQHKVRAAQLETQIEQQKQVVKPTNLFSTGIHMRQTVSLQPVPKIEEVLYHYKPLRIEICGPQVPELEQLGRLGAHIHLMGLSGLEGPEGEGSEVADPGGAEVQDQNGAELSSGSSGDERCSLYQVASGLSGLCDASPSPTAAAVRREGSCPACQPASTASNRYLNHVRAAMPQDTAGGYTSALACHRAIQDAFSGLFPPKG